MFDPNRFNHRNAFEGIGWLIAGLILLPMTLVCFGIYQILSKCGRHLHSRSERRNLLHFQIEKSGASHLLSSNPIGAELTLRRFE